MITYTRRKTREWVKYLLQYGAFYSTNEHRHTTLRSVARQVPDQTRYSPHHLLVVAVSTLWTGPRVRLHVAPFLFCFSTPYMTGRWLQIWPCSYPWARTWSATAFRWPNPTTRRVLACRLGLIYPSQARLQSEIWLRYHSFYPKIYRLRHLSSYVLRACPFFSSSNPFVSKSLTNQPYHSKPIFTSHACFLRDQASLTFLSV
jgi:hypothetical protein